MSPFQAIILGIVQGLTEFLPVSSSAHLVLVPYFLGWEIPENVAFVFDVLVQVATLVGVIAYFWRDLWEVLVAFFQGIVSGKPLETPPSRLGWWLILATIPAGLVGYLFKGAISAAFSNPVVTALFLFVTAGLLALGEMISKRQRDLEQMRAVDALWVGLFQAIAVFPGISRSGATMCGGMTRHFDRPAAARFSFLLSIPIMLAAGLLAGLDFVKMPELVGWLPAFLPGFVASALVGYMVIRWLLRYLVNHSLIIFSWYCVAVGSLTLLITWLR